MSFFGTQTQLLNTDYSDLFECGKWITLGLSTFLLNSNLEVLIRLRVITSINDSKIIERTSSLSSLPATHSSEIRIGQGLTGYVHSLALSSSTYTNLASDLTFSPPGEDVLSCPDSAYGISNSTLIVG